MELKGYYDSGPIPYSPDPTDNIFPGPIFIPCLQDWTDNGFQDSIIEPWSPSPLMADIRSLGQMAQRTYHAAVSLFSRQRIPKDDASIPAETESLAPPSLTLPPESPSPATPESTAQEPKPDKTLEEEKSEESHGTWNFLRTAQRLAENFIKNRTTQTVMLLALFAFGGACLKEEKEHTVIDIDDRFPWSPKTTHPIHREARQIIIQPPLS